MILTAIFGPQHAVTWWQECLRALLIFAYGLLLVRLAGRRVFGRWAALDMIVSVIIGSNLSRALTGTAPLWGTMAASGVLIAIHWVLARWAASSPRVSDLLEGRPIVLAEEATLRRDVMVYHNVSERDLESALRETGVGQIGAAKRVTLEPSGTITVLKRD